MNATKNGIASIKMKRILINICKYVLLIFAAFVALVPIVSCIFTAFKTKEEYASTNVITLPKSFLNFDNFIIAWNKASMGKAFLNSFIILICVLVGSILISAMLAYVLNRFKFPGNKLIRNLFTIATLIPGIASQVTVYQIICNVMVDKRPGSEWFWEVDADGKPSSRKPILEPWKCPYHNGRMCMELIRRNPDVTV